MANSSLAVFYTAQRVQDMSTRGRKFYRLVSCPALVASVPDNWTLGELDTWRKGQPQLAYAEAVYWRGAALLLPNASVYARDALRWARAGKSHYFVFEPNL